MIWLGLCIIFLNSLFKGNGGGHGTNSVLILKFPNFVEKISQEFGQESCGWSPIDLVQISKIAPAFLFCFHRLWIPHYEALLSNWEASSQLTSVNGYQSFRWTWNVLWSRQTVLLYNYYCLAKSLLYFVNVLHLFLFEGWGEVSCCQKGSSWDKKE